MWKKSERDVKEMWKKSERKVKEIFLKIHLFFPMWKKSESPKIMMWKKSERDFLKCESFVKDFGLINWLNISKSSPTINKANFIAKSNQLTKRGWGKV